MFQSTHSLRSATQYITDEQAAILVSIHALLAECDRWHVPHLITLLVSIHALLAECDFLFFRPSSQSNRFQSTHSLRSATYGYLVTKPDGEVSIHALLAECDRVSYRIIQHASGFNPRTPCGVRRKMPGNYVISWKFQSTHSLRSATGYRNWYNWTQDVSIHALLAECDRVLICDKNFNDCFNPRTPCGVRPDISLSCFYFDLFQSTHSLRSATFIIANQGAPAFRFNPRTPCGVRLPDGLHAAVGKKFQSTHSLRSATGCGTFQDYPYRVSIHALLAECDR